MLNFTFYIFFYKHLLKLNSVEYENMENRCRNNSYKELLITSSVQ